MDNIENEIFTKYLEIKQDLINNLKDVFNREHYYTHKYRGNIVSDINVSLSLGAKNEKIIQIFVRSKGKWIKDILSLYDSKLFNSEVTTNLYNE